MERHAGANPGDLDSYRADVPLDRLGLPDDAAAVSFLASAHAGFVTGEQITVNGGHTIG